MLVLARRLPDADRPRRRGAGRPVRPAPPASPTTSVCWPRVRAARQPPGRKLPTSVPHVGLVNSAMNLDRATFARRSRRSRTSPDRPGRAITLDLERARLRRPRGAARAGTGGGRDPRRRRRARHLRHRCGDRARRLRRGAARRRPPHPRPRVARPRGRGAEGSGFAPGDLVVGDRPPSDPVPCPSCAAGNWDFCRNGQYTERGIEALHGYGSNWRIEPGSRSRLTRRSASSAS